MDQTIKRVVADIDSIRNDQLTSKELEIIKQEEADAFFKKTANDYFNKLRELDDQIRECKFLLVKIFSFFSERRESYF